MTPEMTPEEKTAVLNDLLEFKEKQLKEYNELFKKISKIAQEKEILEIIQEIEIFKMGAKDLLIELLDQMKQCLLNTTME